MTIRRVLAVAMGTLLVPLGCETGEPGDGAGEPRPTAVETTIGTDGGEVSVADVLAPGTRITIRFDAGALTQESTVVVRSGGGDVALPDGFVAIGDGFSVDLDGARLAIPAALEVDLGETRLPQGLGTPQLLTYNEDVSGWVIVGSHTEDGGKRVAARVPRFSWFQIVRWLFPPFEAGSTIRWAIDRYPADRGSTSIQEVHEAVSAAFGVYESYLREVGIRFEESEISNSNIVVTWETGLHPFWLGVRLISLAPLVLGIEAEFVGSAVFGEQVLPPPHFISRRVLCYDDLVFANRTLRWGIKDEGSALDESVVDIQELVMHEVGHLLGLAHNCDCESPPLMATRQDTGKYGMRDLWQFGPDIPDLADLYGLGGQSPGGGGCNPNVQRLYDLLREQLPAIGCGCLGGFASCEEVEQLLRVSADACCRSGEFDLCCDFDALVLRQIELVPDYQTTMDPFAVTPLVVCSPAGPVWCD